MEPVLKILNLNTGFKTKDGIVHAAGDINLEIKKGEIWGLIGETGCGKSVLGQAVLRLLPSNARIDGEILFQGKNLLEFSSVEIRRIRGHEIAYICQNPAESLNPVLKNGTQLMESVHIHMGTKRAESRRIAERLLEELHFDSPRKCMESYPMELSGGMKQRVLAAMGMSGQPKLLIADEPTKGLDALIRGQVIQTLRKFIETFSCSALIITHDLKFAQALCTHIAVMYAGELVETGAAKELLENPKHPYLKALINSQPHKGLQVLSGSPCSLIQLPANCRFYERCGQRGPECKNMQPQMLDVEVGRKVRCFYYDRG